jgi:hypothetical protein
LRSFLDLEGYWKWQRFYSPTFEALRNGHGVSFFEEFRVFGYTKKNNSNFSPEFSR